MNVNPEYYPRITAVRTHRRWVNIDPGSFTKRSGNFEYTYRHPKRWTTRINTVVAPDELVEFQMEDDRNLQDFAGA